MLDRLRKIVLWQYPKNTSVETLLRHRRWPIRVVYTWTTSSVLMISSMAQCLLSKEGVLRSISMVVVLVSCGVSLLLSVPAILAMFWANDIDKALRARGYDASTADRLDRRAGVAAMKMCFWAFIIVLLANALRS